MLEANTLELGNVFEAVMASEWNDFTSSINDQTQRDAIRETILQEIRGRVEKVIHHPQGRVDVSLIARNVVRENKKNIAYDRYAELMRRQKRYPVPQLFFDKITDQFPFTPYQRFLLIEKKGIQVGSKVIYDYDKKIYEVIKISEKCVLIIKPESTNPTFKKSGKCRRVMVVSCNPV